MKRVVAVVQVVALLCAAAFVVLLFANEPDTPAAGTATTDASGQVATAAPSGSAVYANRCASCHGGDGAGGLGPALSAGRVVRAFPNVADQIKVITDGRGGMPSFGTRLSAAEIAAVAEFERSL